MNGSNNISYAHCPKGLKTITQASKDPLDTCSRSFGLACSRWQAAKVGWEHTVPSKPVGFKHFFLAC